VLAAFCLLLLTLAGTAAAAKSVVRTVGSAAGGGSGGLFVSPRGIAVNQSGAGNVAAGTFYVADSGNSRIERFGPNGEFVSAWGWGVASGAAESQTCTVAASCHKGLSGSGAGELGENGARGIAVDQANGDVYVADQASENRRIDIFTASGTFVGAFGWGARSEAEELQFCTTVTGCGFANLGSEGQGGQLGPAIGGIAVDGSGRVYVANESFQRVDLFKPVLSGGAVTGIEFVRSFGWNVTIGGGEEFEVCAAAAECQAGSPGNGAGQFGEGSPSDLVVDGEGNLFALDSANDRVEEFDSSSSLLTASFASAGLSSAFGTGTLWNLAISPSGHLFAAGSRSGAGNRVAIAELSHEGLLLETHGLDLTPTSSSGLAAASGSLGGNLYLSAAGTDNRLFVLNEAPTMAPVTTFTGTTATFEGEVTANGFPTEYHFEYSSDGQSWISVPSGYAQLEVPPAAEITPTGPSVGSLKIAATGGTFTLGYAGETTVPLAYNAPPATVEAALEALPAIGGGNVTVSGGPGSPSGSTPYELEFTGALSGVEVWEIFPDGSGLSTPPIPVSQGVSGLTGSQLYHVRLVQNRPSAGGTASSGETTFTTAAAAPAIRGTVASLVSSASATLNARLDPQNQSTTYHFEYGLSDCSTGTCTSLPSAQASGGGLRQVSQSLDGLQPQTVYHFRLVASNGTGTTPGPDRTFVTFAAGANLPDDRGYELVSPADTGGVVPSAAGLGEAEGRDCFITSTAASNGESVIFQSLGGAFPGAAGNGTFDEYQSRRTASGWTSKLISPLGVESEFPSAGGCAASDHSYATFRTGSSPGDNGSLALGGKASAYLISGSAPPELAGKGSLRDDQDANVRWISAGGHHVVFTSNLKLESNAPNSVGPGEEAVSGLKTDAVYDRRPGGPTEVVSLLPGGGAPDSSTETTYYQGTSSDGGAVVFKVEEALEGQSTIYERRGGETLTVASGPSVGSVIFAGVSEGGSHVFYVEPDLPGIGSLRGRGRLFEFNAETETSQPITPGGTAHFVNVSADGSRAYFVSPEILDGSAGESGGVNLYLWNGSSAKFIAVLDEEDVGGDISLSHWTEAVVSAEQTAFLGFATDPSRTTPDGRFFVFESRASLTGYDSGNHTEIFRYSAADGDGSIVCVSCSPMEEPAAFDSKLENTLEGGSQVRAPVRIDNITEDGQTVFFGTREKLLPNDVNGVSDVYEWRAGQGISLISAGTGSRSFLYGMTPDGHDVFFTTKDALVAQDTGAIDSIYDARVGGGFPAPPTVPARCQGDACQGAGGGSPSLPAAATEGDRGGSNVPNRAHCPKGKHRVRRGGKGRCVTVKKRHRHNHRRHAGGGRKGASR